MADTTAALLARFRNKFIFTNMLFALVVVLLVFGSVLGISYRQHVRDVYDALDARISMTGRLGGGNLGGIAFGAFDPNILDGLIGEDNALGEGQAATSGEGEAMSQPNESQARPPAGDGDQIRREASDDQFVATALYFVRADGTVVSGHNEAFEIDDDLLGKAISQAMEEVDQSRLGSAKGSLSDLNLYFRVRPAHTDDTFAIAFASGKYIKQNMINLGLMMLLAGIVAVLAFFWLSLKLSKWATQPVEQAWTQQQQFIADASHELKTPLTVITANDSILLSQPEATIESQRQWIESTETEAHLMQELVNDMLYLAKSDAAEQPLEYGQVDLSQLATSQLLQFESVAFEKGVQTSSHIAEGVMLEGDGSRLQRLVGILLDNACKYVDENGQIDVLLRATDKVCILQVRNTGPVVDAQDIPHLFDRFYRSDKARTRGAGGFGLGLSIAKSIVDDHKGSIRVASSKQDGTVFTVELPLSR